MLITGSVHATEIAASQMSMELAYDLVTGKTPYDADKMLSEVILLLVPTHNPDGNQMVVDWYKKYVGTQFEGGSMPWLYHPYAGHDDNRDFYMNNLVESRAVTKVLYHDWLPQIQIDEHQMGSTGRACSSRRSWIRRFPTSSRSYGAVSTWWEPTWPSICRRRDIPAW